MAYAQVEAAPFETQATGSGLTSIDGYLPGTEYTKGQWSSKGTTHASFGTTSYSFPLTLNLFKGELERCVHFYFGDYFTDQELVVGQNIHLDFNVTVANASAYLKAIIVADTPSSPGVATGIASYTYATEKQLGTTNENIVVDLPVTLSGGGVNYSRYSLFFICSNVATHSSFSIEFTFNEISIPIDLEKFYNVSYLLAANANTYGFRNNDGNELSATWITSSSTNTVPAADVFSLDTYYRIRFQWITLTYVGANAAARQHQLMFRVNGGSWQNVTTTTAIESGNQATNYWTEGVDAISTGIFTSSFPISGYTRYALAEDGLSTYFGTAGVAASPGTLGDAEYYFAFNSSLYNLGDQVELALIPENVGFDTPTIITCPIAVLNLIPATFTSTSSITANNLGSIILTLATESSTVQCNCNSIPQGLYLLDFFSETGRPLLENTNLDVESSDTWVQRTGGYSLDVLDGNAGW